MWVTFSTSVPVSAMVLKYCLCLMIVSVNRCALNPTLATMSAHCVVNVNFPPLGFLVKPPKRFFGSSMAWIESFLEGCLRGFDLLARAIDYRFSLGTTLGMTLKVASLCESRVAMSPCIRFRQPCNIFYYERVPLKNANCQNILQLSCRVSSNMPYHFGIFTPLGLINPDAEPIRESGALTDSDVFPPCLIHPEMFLDSWSVCF